MVLKNTFIGFSSLTNITIPLGIAKIASHTFEGCLSLACVSIPKIVEIIERNVIFGETTLE